MIGIINYDSGNIRSVQNALERIGISYVLSDNPKELDACEKIIFPGVGSAKSAMQSLKAKNLDVWIKNCRKPFLGICLGMQLLFEFSEEGNTECLGIIPGKVKKFKPTKKVPHIGWNNVKAQLKTEDEKFEKAYFYFVHSYLAPINKFTLMTCQYEDEIFSAQVKKDNFQGMQFHPEKSGNIGQKILSEFLKNE